MSNDRASPPVPKRRTWYCEAADDHESPCCPQQCAGCKLADEDAAADAKTFHENMERECKP